MRMSNNTMKYKLLMSNVVEKNSGFSCCTVQGARQLVVVYVSEFKQMVIKNNKETEVLYCFNFNTIQARVQYYDIDTNSFMLEINKNVILKFENQ